MPITFDAIEALELAEKELGIYGDVAILVRKSGLCTLELRIVVCPRTDNIDQQKYSAACYIGTREVAALIPPLKYRFETMLAALKQHIEKGFFLC